MHTFRVPVVLLVVLTVVLSAAQALRAAEEDPFAANVRPTEPRMPQDQLAALKVPAGFAVQLVTCEPDIHKPMNLAFDALGRLWVTTSREYPFPVPADRPGRDRVMVFEDFGADGRARKATEFAGGLNIPTGVYPFRSPNADGKVTWKAVVWSIPNLWLLEDVDGDGKADRREKLYGPFDHTRDTHGNQSSFRRGFDGWLYATHGFNNDSHVAGRDGHRVDLNSGNTYRMRLDGARIEHYTWGQVNPFGLAWDPQGNLYSSDCHSEPIYLLLAGGYYPSFGKPHDGLGFAPNMMEKIRGSTAIDAITYYADNLWPETYRDAIFVGDVMTSRVYRDTAVVRGSGRVTHQEPDFVISEDPWFRPVDSTLGPDGALYIADFYNRIIGHYEVPLNHPGRDRERGRIWRVVALNAEGKPALRSSRLAEDLEGLVGELGSPSLPRRLLAMNDLADRFGASAVPRLRQVLTDMRGRSSFPENTEDAWRHVHTLWLLERLGAGDDSPRGPVPYAASRGNPLLRIHALRILVYRGELGAGGDAAARDRLKPLLAGIAVPGLQDPDAVTRRVSAQALGTTPAFGHTRPLLDALERADSVDTHLVYALRQALRNQLVDDEVMGEVRQTAWSDRDLLALADVAVAVKSEAAARFLVQSRTRLDRDPGLADRALLQAARYAPSGELDTLVAWARTRSPDDVDSQLGVFRVLQQGLAQRGVELSSALRTWGAVLASELLRSTVDAGAWVNQPLDASGNGVNPWEFQERSCADGQRARLLSSHPRGEALTGVLRSRPFPAPAKLSFYLAGHDGYPDRGPQRKNAARLCEAGTRAVLREAFAPRNDTAQKVEWDLVDLGGRMVRWEVVDGDDGDAFAWLAFGRVEPATVPSPTLAPATLVAREVAAAELVAVLGAEAADLKPTLMQLAHDTAADPGARAAAARAVFTDPVARAAADLVGDSGQPAGWRARTADVLFDERRRGAEELIADVWKAAPHRFQVKFAGLSAASPVLAAEIVKRMSEGRAPAALLQDRDLRERLRRAADEPTRALLDPLVSRLPDEDETARRLLDDRRRRFAAAHPDVGRGREVFRQGCAPCHQINGEGGLIGPQLTGIGTRGLERLSEDILLPNRNVDRAFWTTALTLKDGDTVTGLFRREEGELLVLANAAGAEFTVRKSDVVSRQESGVSIMPSNWGEALSADDLYHLLAYLLTQTGRP